MNVRLESMSHGDGKVYLQMVIDRIHADAAVLLDARLKSGQKIPAHLFPFRPQEEASSANYVVVLPHFEVREVDLSFVEYTGQGTPLSQSRLTVELNAVRWKTRLNALVRNELINQMFDIEREYCADRMNIYFTDAIEDGDEIVVKMLVDMPHVEGSDVMVDFLDRSAAEIELPVYPLVDEVIPAQRFGDEERLHVGFSVRVRAEAKDFCVTVYDAQEQVPGGFALFCEDTHEPLRESYAYCATDASRDLGYVDWYQHHCETLAGLALQRKARFAHEPIVSLVVPARSGDECYMPAALRAIHQQTYELYEVVVADAGLDPHAFDAVAREWEGDARLVHIALDAQASDASLRLTGIMQSTGDVCAVLDPSIILAPEALFEYVRRVNEVQGDEGYVPSAAKRNKVLAAAMDRATFALQEAEGEDAEASEVPEAVGEPDIAAPAEVDAGADAASEEEAADAEANEGGDDAAAESEPAEGDAGADGADAEDDDADDADEESAEDAADADEADQSAVPAPDRGPSFEPVRAVPDGPVGACEVVYANHDVYDRERGFCKPAFKPSFSPDLLYSYDYMGPLVFISRPLIDEVAADCGFATEAFEYDLCLKATGRALRVERIDQVLYHVQEAASISPEAERIRAKREEEAFRGGRKAVANQLRRKGIGAIVLSEVADRCYRVQYRLAAPQPSLTVIVPSKDQVALLDTCLSALFEGNKQCAFDVVVVDNASTDAETLRYYREVQRAEPRIRVVAYEGPFNQADMINAAMQICDSDFVLLLDNDTELIGAESLSALLAHCQREDVGVVGAKMLFPDDTIQHAGMMVGPNGSAANIGVNLPRSARGYGRRLSCMQNLSCVSGACMMVKRSVYDEVGGFDRRFLIGGYDVDFCLKVREAGYFVAYNGSVELYHQENATSGHVLTPAQRLRAERERAFLHYRWPRYFVEGDPFMSAGFDATAPYYLLGS